jgi:gluconolactonase
MDFEIEQHDNRIDSIIEQGAVLELVATGFRFLEGPAWHPVNRTLIFSDIKGNGIYIKDAEDRILLFRDNSHLANGNTYDLAGRLLTCEHGTSRVTRTEQDGSLTVLASRYNGKQLNSPNDIVVANTGVIYFTDPASGRTHNFGIPREQELAFQGVYRIDSFGELTLLVDDFVKPNGLCLSNDEKQLFVNDTERQHIRCFDVTEDGILENDRLWVELIRAGKDVGVADGMKFDSGGFLYCSGPGGIHIFDSEASLIARLLIPEQAANFAWGDDDLCSLYITATTSLYRLRMKIPGKRLF